MTPNYPKVGNYYEVNEETKRYEAATPAGGVDLSIVPTMNRAERRRQERMAGAFKKSGKRR